MNIRLNVYLKEHGIASRRKADDLISSGAVKVNGRMVSELGTRVSEDDEIMVNGVKVRKRAFPKVTYLLHKPDMTITSSHDPQGRETIFNLHSLKELPPNVQPVGRLDYRTEGLLLLTNDGDLAYALTHPSQGIEKRYAVLVSDEFSAEDTDRLRKGVMLEDGLAKAVSVRIGSRESLNGQRKGRWVEVVIMEGRNRLVRRMFESIGYKIVRLARLGIGDISLPSALKPGECRLVNASEQSFLESIKKDIDSQNREGKQIPKNYQKRLKKLSYEEYCEKKRIEGARSHYLRKSRRLLKEGSENQNSYENREEDKKPRSTSYGDKKSRSTSYEDKKSRRSYKKQERE